MQINGRVPFSGCKECKMFDEGLEKVEFQNEYHMTVYCKNEEVCNNAVRIAIASQQQSEQTPVEEENQNE